MKTISLIIGLLLGILCQLNARIYVCVEGRGSGDGSSWDDAMAYDDFKNELYNNNIANGEEVWMEKGRYSGLFFSNTVSTPGLTFYGGFDREPLAMLRKLDQNETVLVGQVDELPIHFERGTKQVSDGFVLEGIAAEGGSLYIVHNLSEFRNIKIRGQVGGGEAVFVEGTLDAGEPGTCPKLINVLISDIECLNAITVVGSSLELINVTITDNILIDGSIDVRGPDAFVYINNSIISGNSTDEIFFSGTGFPSSPDPANSVCSYSLLGADFLGIVEEGVLFEVDPLFTEDYHLQPESPCIDAGNDDNYSDAFGRYDLDGNMRRIGIIDMGAYEYQY